MAEAPSFTGEVRMLIDGKLVEADSGKRFENINPANEEVLGEVADASATDMRRAIAAARRAFDEGEWPRLTPAERADYLTRMADAIAKRQSELAELITEELGCTLGDGRIVCGRSGFRSLGRCGALYRRRVRSLGKSPQPGHQPPALCEPRSGLAGSHRPERACSG